MNYINTLLIVNVTNEYGPNRINRMNHIEYEPNRIKYSDINTS